MATGNDTGESASAYPEEPCRIRPLTEKGREYSKQLLIDRRKKLWKLLEKQMNEVTQLFEVSSNVCVVESERQQFDKILAEFYEVTTAYKDY